MARILVIDDDADLLATLTRILAANGHDVVAAGDGRAATELLEGDPVDLVLTDINMPTMDGIEVMTWVRDRFDIPVIAMSGGGLFRKEELLTDAAAFGAEAVLEKPMEMDLLLKTIDAALRRGDRSQSGGAPDG